MRLKTPKELIATVKRVYLSLSASGIYLYTAQTAYYIIFSFPPLLMLSLMSAKVLFPHKIRELSLTLTDLFPEVFENLPADFLEHLLGSDIPLFSLTLLAMIWSASKWARSLSCGLSRIYGHEKNGNLISRYLGSIAFTLGFIFMISFSVGFVLSSDFFSFNAPEFIRTPLFSLFFAVIIFFINKFMAAGNEKAINLIPGSVFSSTAWTVYTSLFKLYARHYSNYSILYGSIGLILVAMLYIYNCVLILFLGAALNVYLKRKPLIIK